MSSYIVRLNKLVNKVRDVLRAIVREEDHHVADGAEFTSSGASIVIGHQRIPFTSFEIIGERRSEVVARGRMLLSDYIKNVLGSQWSREGGVPVVVRVGTPDSPYAYYAVLNNCSFTFKGPSIVCDGRALEKEVTITAESMHERRDGTRWSFVAGTRGRDGTQDNEQPSVN